MCLFKTIKTTKKDAQLPNPFSLSSHLFLKKALYTGFLTASLALFGAFPIKAGDTTTYEKRPTHGVSMFDDLALGPAFPHFPYVNPIAPKGGEFRQAAIGSFDNLNPFTIKGQTVQGITLIYDTLLTNSAAEPGAAYGLLAEKIELDQDKKGVRFTLRKQARFHDGTPVTAKDVVWSFDAIRNAHPFYDAYFHDIEKAIAVNDHVVAFTFKQSGNRELPLILGQLPILPKHYWSANERSLDKTTLEPPLGSGPYKVGKITTGRTIVFERVKNYWANDLNVTIGQYNFDTIRYDYFGDDTVAFEAFKSGDFDIRREFSSKNWATGYNIDAVNQGRIKLDEVALQSGSGMQAFIMNTRRVPFNDSNIRHAFNLAFDFEWTNKNLFYGQYARTNSFFQNSELASSGLPSADELALLEPFRDQLPPELFITPFKNPVSDGSGNIRNQLRQANVLLKKSGWLVKDGELQKDGQVMEIEFLIVQPNFERVIAPYIQNLKKLGIKANIRVVDPTQYQNRLNKFDYDVIVSGFPQSLSPGNEQRDFWSSASADREGGRNAIGIKNPVIDNLIDKLVFANTRQDLVTATKALDRVLLWNHYVVPQWYSPNERLAYWQGIAHPEPMPPYALGLPQIWWRTAPPPYKTAQDNKANGEPSAE